MYKLIFFYSRCHPAKIQALKKTATKGDKKKKKEVAEEITKIEKELSLRHEAELKQFKVEKK